MEWMLTERDTQMEDDQTFVSIQSLQVYNIVSVD